VENLDHVANVVVGRVGLRNQAGYTQADHNLPVLLRQAREIEILQNRGEPLLEAFGKIGADRDGIVRNGV
jgi:hypothetical protein